MAIDFSQVKAITIPEGPLCEITDSTGNILWEGVGWHTIWKGSKSCRVNAKGNTAPVLEGAEDNFAQTKSGTGYTPKIRITFTIPSWGNNKSSFQYLIVKSLLYTLIAIFLFSFYDLTLLSIHLHLIITLCVIYIYTYKKMRGNNTNA